MSEIYKKHIINPKAGQRPSGRWSGQILIYREHGNHGTETSFTIKGDFESKEQAISTAIAAGKWKIDKGYDDSNAVQNLDPANFI
jgi:hypothetical protein